MGYHRESKLYFRANVSKYPSDTEIGEPEVTQLNELDEKEMTPQRLWL